MFDIGMDPGLHLREIRRARFVFAPEAPIRLQPHSGSAWRGAFGHALQPLLCAAGRRPCTACDPDRACAFAPLFRGGEDGTAARPFILAPQPTPRSGWIGAEEPFAVDLTLFRRAQPIAAYAARALVEAGRRGLTARRIPFRLERIEEIDGAGGLLAPRDLSPPPAPAEVRLRLVTPLRLRLGGDLVTGRRLRPRDLIDACLRRLRGLELAAPMALAEAARREAEGLAFEELRWGWLETVRESSRQRVLMRLGGIVGEARLPLRGRPALWPLLWAAGEIHLGKGASMGFGRLAVEPL